MARASVRWLAPGLLLAACNDAPLDLLDKSKGTRPVAVESDRAAPEPQAPRAPEPAPRAPEPAKVPVLADNGYCGDMLRFTGEYVDWDHAGARSCAISGARFEARDSSGVVNTGADGRFDLCVPNQPVSIVEISPPEQPTQCSTKPGSYALPGLAVVSKDVFLAGGAWSGRAFVVGRQAVNPAKAQVFVHVHGAARSVAIGAAHGRAQARSGSGWQPGTTGQDVFFQDVEVGRGETTIRAPNAIVPPKIPLVAGTLTNVTIVAK